MGMKLKKLWPLFGVISMGLLAPAFADQCQHSGGPQQSMASTQQNDQGAYQREMYREVTPAAGPVVANGVNLFFRVDPLYWRAVPDGNAYAYYGFKTEENTTTVEQPAPLGRVATIDSKWGPGVKLGLGAHLGHDGWDMFLRYTYLHPKGKGKLPVGEGEFSAAFSANPGGRYVAPAGESWGSADWKFQFHVLDLDLGRNSYLSPFLTVRPHIGLKFTWQRDEMDICLRSTKFNLSSAGPAGAKVVTPVTGPYYSRLDYDILGVGLRCGCDFSWFFCKGFGIYGDFAWDVLWTSYYDQRRVDKLHEEPSSGDPVDIIVINTEDAKYYAAKNLCEFECGFVWETWLCDDDYHVEARLGCEGQVWINWIRDLSLIRGSYSNLSFYGPKATVRFDF